MPLPSPPKTGPLDDDIILGASRPLEKMIVPCQPWEEGHSRLVEDYQAAREAAAHGVLGKPEDKSPPTHP